MGKIDESNSTCSANVSCSGFLICCKVIEPLLSAGSLFFFFLPGRKAVELN